MQPIKNIFPPPIRPLRIRQNRRILTAASLTLLVSSLLLVAFRVHTWALLALVLSSVLGVVLQFATRNLSNSTDLITDERERHLRDHAHRIAYWTMAGVLGGIVGLVLGFFSTRSGKSSVFLVIDLTKLETWLLLAAFYGVFLGLPTWIIAWLEPDSLEE